MIAGMSAGYSFSEYPWDMEEPDARRDRLCTGPFTDPVRIAQVMVVRSGWLSFIDAGFRAILSGGFTKSRSFAGCAGRTPSRLIDAARFGEYMLEIFGQ